MPAVIAAQPTIFNGRAKHSACCQSIHECRRSRQFNHATVLSPSTDIAIIASKPTSMTPMARTRH